MCACPPLHRMSQLDVELDFTMSERKSQTDEFLKKRAVRAVSLSTRIGNHIPSHLILNSIFPGQKPLDIGLTSPPPPNSVCAHINTKCRASITNCGRWNTISQRRCAVKTEELSFFFVQGHHNRKRANRFKSKRSRLGDERSNVHFGRSFQWHNGHFLFTCCEEDDGFETRIFSRINMKGFEFLHLLLEDADVIHESDDTVGSHGTGVKSSGRQ